MPCGLAAISAFLLSTAAPPSHPGLSEPTRVERAAASLRAADAIGVVATARSIQPGELVVLTMTMPGPVENVRVRAFGRDLRAFSISPRTWRVLVGIDLAVAAGAYPVSIDARSGAETIGTTYQLLVRPRRFATRALRVDEAFVNPPRASQARIAEEAAELQRLWTESAADRLWDGPFVRPVPGPATSRFGTRSVFNGRPRSPHSGADLMSPAGTPIRAPNGGRIVLARELYFTGNTVMIDHGLGLVSMLAHLSVMNAREGAPVLSGDIVGLVGSTGRVTGPHLHWAVRAGGARIDPLSILALLGPETR